MQANQTLVSSIINAPGTNYETSSSLSASFKNGVVTLTEGDFVIDVNDKFISLDPESKATVKLSLGKNIPSAKVNLAGFGGKLSVEGSIDFNDGYITISQALSSNEATTEVKVAESTSSQPKTSNEGGRSTPMRVNMDDYRL